MGLVLKDSGDFKLAPEGQHNAVCVDVVDHGMVSVEWQGKKKQQHKCRIVWEIEQKDDKGFPLTVGRRFTASLSSKATLRAFLEQWRGRAFTEEELKGFDSEVLIGVPALIQVVYNKVGDKTYDNVNAIMKVPKGSTPLAPSGSYVRVKDRTESEQAAEPAPIDDDENSVPF